MADDSPKIYQFARGMTMTDEKRIMLDADLAHATLRNVLTACKFVANPDLPPWFKALFLVCSADWIDYMTDLHRRMARDLPPPTGKLLASYSPETGWVDC